MQEDVRAPGVFATCSSHHVNYAQRVITGGACRTAAHRNSHVHTSADEENEIVERERCKGRKQTLRQVAQPLAHLACTRRSN